MKINHKPGKLVEELAELRHNQMKSWSGGMFIMLNNAKHQGKTFDEAVDELLKLCEDNWVDYNKLPDKLKDQSRVFAYAVLDLVDKHNK